MNTDLPVDNTVPPGPAASSDPRGAPSREAALEQSALLHAVRASVLRIEVERGAGRRPLLGRGGLVASRALHRVRFAALVIRRTLRSLREDGASATIGRARHHLGGAGTEASRHGRSDAAPLPVAAPVLLRHRVLIVAELRIPQCAKYRVWQKQAQIEHLGIPCTVLDWQQGAEARSRLQSHTLLLLYRVPGDETARLLADSRRLGVETIWEVDDLIFDLDLYRQNANLRALPAAEQRDLLAGAALYRRAMLAADRTVASTATLAAAMSRATGKPCDIVENALDRETLDFARHAREAASERPASDTVVIVYGSGTSTHDADFAMAAPSLLRMMRADSRIVLRLVGPLRIPAGFAAVSGRIERVAFTNYRAYLAVLAAADIAIAPLEATVFNDAKSNIKLIEAAIVGLPCVCSPCAEFARVITHGVDGLLAGPDTEWFDQLRALTNDKALRHGIAAAADAMIRQRYDPAMIARDQVAPILQRQPPTRRAGFRILVVNIFYAPRSFGGATIIAEEMARGLAARADTEVFVFTSHGRDAAPYTLHRYHDRGVEVFGVALRGGHDDILAFDDPEIGRVFADVLASVVPDIVHLHSIQGLGAAVPRACQAASIPYVVTVHDAWWLCQRQFMVRADNTYCHQTTIDLKICQSCLPGAGHLRSRMDILMQALDAAALVLSPSASHASLYLANGIQPERMRVHRNGIRPPGRTTRSRPAGPLRFGYVGGNEKLKGVGGGGGAVAARPPRDWTLVLVDNTRNLGFSSFDRRDWRFGGRVEIVPAYLQDELDDFFRGLDVLLFPSQWKESFGLTVREALARDVWVIATDGAAAAEDIVDGVNGTLVPMGNDPLPLASAIVAVLERPRAMRDHVNPRKHALVTLDQQEAELDALLRAAAAPRVNDLRANRGPGVKAAEQQQQQHDDQQEHAEAAAGPTASNRTAAAVVAAIPAAPVAGVAEAAERDDQEDNQKDREHRPLRGHER